MPVRLTVCVARSFSLNWKMEGLIGSIVGGALVGMTVTVKLCGILVSWPPLAVPPLSITVTVIVATPLAFGRTPTESVPVVLGLV